MKKLILVLAGILSGCTTTGTRHAAVHNHDFDIGVCVSWSQSDKEIIYHVPKFSLKELASVEAH